MNLRYEDEFAASLSETATKLRLYHFLPLCQKTISVREPTIHARSLGLHMQSNKELQYCVLLPMASLRPRVDEER
jgi:hypothetical protein